MHVRFGILGLSSLSTIAMLALACGSSPPPQTPPTTAGTGAAAPGTPSPIDTPPLASTDLAVTATDAGTKLPPAPAGKGEPGRSVEDIRVRVQANRDAARACYDAGRKRIPALEGDIVIKWTIDPKGNVRDPEVDDMRSTIKDAPTVACVIDVIRKLKFAESSKGFETHANYPFNFHPKGAKSEPK